MRDLIPLDSSPPAASTGAIPSACAWCGESIDAGGEWVPGGIRCARCGVATTVPWPTEEELDEAYGDAYRPAGGRFAGPGDAVLRRLRGRLAREIDRVAPPGQVLDVGAGDGTLIDALERRGRDAVGLERDSRHPRIRAGELSELEPGWAAVVFWHSLEHLRSPGQALELAAALLGPRGVLVVALPNADSIQARVFGRRWLALDAPRHLVHVPSRALARRLEVLGLEIERTSHVLGGQSVFGWLHGLVGLLPGSPSLWDAIRRPEARARSMGPLERVLALGTAPLLYPVAVACAAIEAALGRGGSFYVQARRA